MQAYDTGQTDNDGNKLLELRRGNEIIGQLSKFRRMTPDRMSGSSVADFKKQSGWVVKAGGRRYEAKKAADAISDALWDQRQARRK